MAPRLLYRLDVMVKYRLLRTIVGMHLDERHPIMIPTGAIVETPPTRSKVGVVRASYEGRMFWVFLHDLLEASTIEPNGDVG